MNRLRWCAARFDGWRGGACVEFEVSPVQAEEFVLAESDVEGESEQSVQPVVLGGGKELAAECSVGVGASGAARASSGYTSFRSVRGVLAGR